MPEVPDGRGWGGGRARILAAAMETLEEHGEAAIRFADVAERAGVVPSVVAHHFGSREGLVSALHAERYLGLTREDEAALRAVVVSARNRDEFAAAATALAAALFEEGRAAVRMNRIVSIGASHRRPELAAQVSEVVTQLLDTITDLVGRGQTLGLFDASVPPRALATFIHASAIGMIANDLDATPADSADLAAVFTRSIAAFTTENAT